MSEPMSQPQTASPIDATSSQTPPPSEALGATARIDPPHIVGQSKTLDAYPSQDAAPTPAIGSNELSSLEGNIEEEIQSGKGLSPERVRRHARQLAAVLRRRQEQLDHREAQLNARSAQIENDVRVLRLIWNERHADWEEKRQLLAEREAVLAQRRAELGEREEALSQREQFLTQWEESLRSREADLAKQEQALEQKRKELARREAAVQFRESDLTALAVLVEEVPSAEEVPGRDDACKASPALEADLLRKRSELVHFWHEAKRLFLELRDARQQWKDEERQWRQRWLVEQRQAMAEISTQRAAIARRAQAMDRLHAELQQLKQEIDAKFREAIEHHLAACELVATLEKEQASAAVAQQLIGLRQKLEESVKASLEEQQQREQRVAAVRAQLQVIHHQIVEEKKRFDEYTKQRLSELEKIASQLTEREKQILLKENEMNERATAWQLAELEYVLEIQRLRDCLEGSVKPEAAAQIEQAPQNF
ncbi:MAG: hypothetical protein ACUVQG_09930 [Thermogutta sp.]